MPTPLSDAQRRQIVAMTMANASASTIARHIGCTTRTVSRVRVAEGVGHTQAPNQGQPITAERLEQIRLLIADATPHAEIVRTAHVGWGTLRKFFPRSSWTPEQAGRYGLLVRNLNRLGVNRT